MGMNAISLMKIFNTGIGQTASSDNPNIQSSDKNMSFLESLKNAILTFERSKQEGLNNIFLEAVETSGKNTEIFSELFLQLLSHVVFNNPQNMETSDELSLIIQAGENGSLESDIFLEKKIAEFLLTITNAILNSIQDTYGICKDPKKPVEAQSDKNINNETVEMNFSAPPSFTGIYNLVNLDGKVKEENGEKPYNHEYVLFDGQSDLSVDHKKDIAKNIKNETVEMNFSAPPSFTGIYNLVNLDGKVKEENGEKPYNHDEAIGKDTFPRILTEDVTEDLSSSKNIIKKEYDLRPEEQGVKISVKNFAVGHRPETRDMTYEFIFKAADPDKMNENMDKQDIDQVRFAIERLNFHDGNLYKAPDVKENEISMRPDLVLSEKIEKITEHFLQDKKIADMIIKFKIDETDIIQVALKREGASISVNIKSTSLEVVHMLNAQKEEIIKGLEDKNITTSISVYPDGKNNQEKGQYGEDGRRQYRKRNNKDEFYEVLMTHKV